MQKITDKLKELKEKNQMGLMTHVVVGYPDLDTTEKLVLEMDRNGADLIELQIPFSDPVADGPTIMKASQIALENGTRVRDAFDLAKRLEGEISAPLLFMTYANILVKYGIEKFCEDAKKVGVEGLIVPDIPPEEGSEYLRACELNDLDPIFIMAPTSTDERLEKIAKAAQGFVYCVARTGVTGAETNFSGDLEKFLNRCRKYTDLSLGVGFGIAKKEDVDFLKNKADFAIVGSQAIRVLEKEGVEAVGEFLRGLKG